MGLHTEHWDGMHRQAEQHSPESCVSIETSLPGAEPTLTQTSSSSIVQIFHFKALSTLLIRVCSLGSQPSKSLCISSISPA